MRVDAISIFPSFFDVLDLSLLGRARGTGLLDLRVHDLRDFTHDRHRTVDDTPYGGGAGMVMKPQPWKEALDHVVATGDGAVPHLLVPSPAGRPFTQALAQELAVEPWLAFACGRYEGIDERVLDHARASMTVTPVSIGDYVLNGGEIATVAMVEAIGRLVPGVVGNPESLVEESHSDGLLEYPVYTKPAAWEGLEVPPVLLSGDHGAIARWRLEQQVERTAARRPDLLELRPATEADLGEILTLQRACWVQEAVANAMLDIPALQETPEDVRNWLTDWSGLVLRAQGRLIGGVRGRLLGDAWEIARLMVAPDRQGEGHGRRLLAAAEDLAPPEAARYELFTGIRSKDNLRMYRRAGYRRVDGPASAGTVRLAKPCQTSASSPVR